MDISVPDLHELKSLIPRSAGKKDLWRQATRRSTKDLVNVLKEFIHPVVTFFRGQIIIVLLQGILIAIGFSLSGLNYGAVLGLILGLLNIVPYLGSMLGLAITLPTTWIQAGGGWDMLLMEAVVLSFVQMLEG